MCYLKCVYHKALYKVTALSKPPLCFPSAAKRGLKILFKFVQWRASLHSGTGDVVKSIHFFFNMCTFCVWLLLKGLEVVVTRRFYAHSGFAFTWLGFSLLLRILAEFHCMCINAQFLVVIILMLYRCTIPVGQDGCT